MYGRLRYLLFAASWWTWMEERDAEWEQILRSIHCFIVWLSKKWHLPVVFDRVPYCIPAWAVLQPVVLQEMGTRNQQQVYCGSNWNLPEGALRLFRSKLFYAIMIKEMNRTSVLGSSVFQIEEKLSRLNHNDNSYAFFYGRTFCWPSPHQFPSCNISYAVDVLEIGFPFYDSSPRLPNPPALPLTARGARYTDFLFFLSYVNI